MWKVRLAEVEQLPPAHMFIRGEALEFSQIQLAIKPELPLSTPHFMIFLSVERKGGSGHESKNLKSFVI